jgi:type I restriction enzyme S subunit
MTLMKGWKTNGLPELLRLMKSGGTPDTTRTDFYGGNIPFVSIEDMTATNKYLDSTTKTLTDDGLQHSNAWIVPENSILYSIYATLGLPRINTIPVATNQAILALIIDPNRVDLDYLYYWLDFVRSCIVSLSSQTTQNNLNATIVKSFLVDHPTSVAEQSQIADILSTVDLAIEQTEALIAKQQRIKTGLMQDLLTRGIDEHGNLRSEETHQFKDSPLGRIPVEWEARYLLDMATCQNGRSFPSSDYSESGVKLVRPGNLAPNGWVVWDKAHTSYLPWSYWDQSRDYQIGPGEILMNLTAQSLEDQFLGRVCMTGDGCICLLNQRIARISAISCRKDFLYWALRGPYFRKSIDSVPQGMKVQHIYNRDLGTIRLAAPKSQFEQQAIGDVLWSCQRNGDTSYRQLAKLHSLKTALMQDLLTGKVRVTPLLDNEEVSSE